MDDSNPQTQQQQDSNNQSLQRWQRILGVIYRLVIILGLVLLFVSFALVFFTSILPYWSIAFPAMLIVLGVILARIEYTLHKRNKNEG